MKISKPFVDKVSAEADKLGVKCLYVAVSENGTRYIPKDSTVYKLVIEAPKFSVDYYKSLSNVSKSAKIFVERWRNFTKTLTKWPSFVGDYAKEELK